MRKLIFILLISSLTACITTDQKVNNIQEYINSAEQYFEQENYDIAKENFDKALSLAKGEYGEQSKEVADICLNIALHTTTYNEAIDYTERGEEIFEKLDDMEGLAEVYFTYATLHNQKHKPEMAQSAYEEALKYCSKSPVDMSAKKFHIYMRLTGLDSTSMEEALQYSKEAEKLIDELPEDEKYEDIINLYYSIGNCYYNLAQYDKAIEGYEKVIQCWVQYGEGDLLQVARSYDLCGYIYSATGDYGKSIEYINQSLECFERATDATLWDYAIAYRHLSVVYTEDEIQDLEKAMEYGIKSCQIYTKQKELSNDELEELKVLKDVLEDLYIERINTGQQDFETWYQEEIK